MTVRSICALAAVLLVGLLPGGPSSAEAHRSGDFCPGDVHPRVVCEDDWPCRLIAVKLDDGGCWVGEEAR